MPIVESEMLSLGEISHSIALYSVTAIVFPMSCNEFKTALLLLDVRWLTLLAG